MPAFARRLKRSLHRFASLLSLCLLLLSSPARSAQKKQGAKTPLASVEAVTDIDAPKDPDDPGTGGGMDAANYFSRKLAPKLGDCTSRIRSTSNDWIQASHLQTTKVDQQPGDLLIHATKPDLNEKLESKSAIQYPAPLVSLRRVASDLVVFQASFGLVKIQTVTRWEICFFLVGLVSVLPVSSDTLLP